MDIFGTVANAIDLSEKILKYLGEVKGGREERENLRDKVTLLKALLPMLRGRIEADPTHSYNIPLFETILNRKCRDILAEIHGKLDKANFKRVDQKLWWPFKREDIIDNLKDLEQVLSLVQIAVNSGIRYVFIYFRPIYSADTMLYLSAMVEHIKHDQQQNHDLVTSQLMRMEEKLEGDLDFTKKMR